MSRTLKKTTEPDIDRPADRVEDGLEVYIHHLDPTPADERRRAEFWRQMIAWAQKGQESQKRS